MKSYITSNLSTILFSLLLLFFAVVSVSSALRESLTFDEIVYLQAGRNEVLYHSFDLDPYNPPLIREISAFPYVFNSNFYKSETFTFQNSLWGRISIVFLGLGLLIAVFIFTKKYLGQNEALFATFLLAIEPNILANSHYVTIDMGLTLFFFMAYSLFVLSFQNTSYKTIILLSLSIGLGMSTKILFIPYFFSTAGILWILRYKMQTISILKKSWIKIFFGICISSFVIWGIYFFNWHVAIKQRDDTTRVSARITRYAHMHHLQPVASALFFLETQPIPLGDYLATLKNSALRGLHADTCFFLGKYYSSCRWYFMPVNFLLKIPLPLLIFFTVSLITYLKKRSQVQFVLLVPIFTIMISSIVFHVNPLVRYILPVMPFLTIFSAFSFSFWQKSFVRKCVFYLLLLWYIFGTLSSFPHFISYANEFAHNQKQFLLTDSNMDWGQSLPDVKEFIQENRINKIKFSYFGRDNGDLYSLHSDKPYGSYKSNEICEFHSIHRFNNGKATTIISSANWYACGYNKLPKYSKEKINKIIGESIFVF